MLINTSKNVAAGDVIAVKLTSGEEILAKLVSVENDVYVFSKPVILTLVPVGNGQASVSFAPFMMGLDEDTDITIEYHKMLMRPIVARKDAASQYIKSTTGLDLSASM